MPSKVIPAAVGWPAGVNVMQRIWEAGYGLQPRPD